MSDRILLNGSVCYQAVQCSAGREQFFTSEIKIAHNGAELEILHAAGGGRGGVLSAEYCR